MSHPGAAPTVVFLGGYASDMTGTKASYLEGWCRARGQAFLRFDYQGHGRSSGRLADGTIGLWRDDALAVLREGAPGPLLLVGSSMGAWIMLLAALAMPERIQALVGVAAAPDFTEDLLWARLGEEQRARLRGDGVIRLPSGYGEPLPFTWRLVEEGRRHLLLRAPIPLSCPVRLLHGTADAGRSVGDLPAPRGHARQPRRRADPRQGRRAPPLGAPRAGAPRGDRGEPRLTRPLQNRVTPFGDLIRTPARGTLMGNRGRLHDARRQIVRRVASGYRAWVTCRLSFRGRHRTVMTPGRYTELFFLDEATALAAGHRPCGECRRADFLRFREAWLVGNPDRGLDADAPAGAIDRELHRDRLGADGRSLAYPATLASLPDGVFVLGRAAVTPSSSGAGAWSRGPRRGTARPGRGVGASAHGADAPLDGGGHRRGLRARRAREPRGSSVRRKGEGRRAVSDRAPR